MATPEQWAAARAAWEGGASNGEAATHVDVTREAVRKRAKREGWQRTTRHAATVAEARAAGTAAATSAQLERWAVRRQDEADRAGVSAAFARSQIIAALQDNNPQMVRAASVAYGILVDKAQLLSGGATDRPEVTVDRQQAKERLAEIIDLAGRRQAS